MATREAVLDRLQWQIARQSRHNGCVKRGDGGGVCWDHRARELTDQGALDAEALAELNDLRARRGKPPLPPS